MAGAGKRAASETAARNVAAYETIIDRTTKWWVVRRKNQQLTELR